MDKIQVFCLLKKEKIHFVIEKTKFGIEYMIEIEGYLKKIKKSLYKPKEIW